MKKTSKSWLIIIGIVVIGLIIALFISFNTAKELPTTDFYSKCGVTFTVKEDSNDKGYSIDVEKVEFDKIVVDVYSLQGYKGGKLIASTYYAREDSDRRILDDLAAHGVKVSFTNPNQGNAFSSVIMPILTIGFGIFLVVIFIRQMGASNKSALDFGKTKAQVITNIKVRFSDVAGADEEKTELQEIVEFLKNPAKFTQLGARTPKGVLLVGLPGTGKTLFAKAVAGEANVPFFSISGSDFVEMFVGVGASRVRDLFNAAKKNQPCIVFIDEIDAVGRQRGAGLGGGNDEREQTLNQLLVQMDGFEATEGIIVMAATNRADVLDPALLRPGRFDRQIYVNMPDVKGREEILKVHARNKPLAKDVSFKILARMTSGFSGADLANLLNEAAILAARADRKFITNIDLYESINKVIMGPQKRSRLITDSDKRMTAYHESGHAILAKLLPNCDPVQEASIIPRGRAGGYTMTRPDGDDYYHTKSKLLDNIVMAMGGRAAEEIVIKEVTSGPSSDIVHVTKIARSMVTDFGMSDLIGPVSYGDNGEIFVGRDYQQVSGYSEKTAMDIDNEVRRIVNDGYAKAVEMLTANRALLDVMARVLIERETIYSDEVDMIMQGKSVEEVLAFMDSKENGNNPLQNAVDKQTNAEVKAEKPQELKPAYQAEELKQNGKQTEKPQEGGEANQPVEEASTKPSDTTDESN